MPKHRSRRSRHFRGPGTHMFEAGVRRMVATSRQESAAYDARKKAGKLTLEDRILDASFLVFIAAIACGSIAYWVWFVFDLIERHG